MRKKNIWGVCFILLSLSLTNAAVAQSTSPDSNTEAHTLYSKLPIKDVCKDSYQSGLKWYQQGVINKQISRQYFDAGMATITEDCQFAFSAGIFDAQGVMIQTIVGEWVLEQSLVLHKPLLAPKKSSLESYYQNRLESLKLPAVLLKQFDSGTEIFQTTLNNLKQNLQNMAEEKREAVVFGRFVFTSGFKDKMFTHKDFEISRKREITFDEQGNAKFKEGNYQRFAKANYNNMYNLTKEYLEWKPTFLLGKDSWFHKGGKTRSAKESYYSSQGTKFFKRAADLNLKLDPYNKLSMLMHQKFTEQLKVDLQVIKTVKYSLYAAPLIPVGIYIGAAGLGSVGISASLSMNISASLAIAPVVYMTGVGVYKAIKYDDPDNPFRITKALDTILVHTISSFPLAAALPAVVGTAAYAGKALWVSGGEFLAITRNSASTLRALGLRGAIRKLPSASLHFIKSYGRAFWNKTLLLNMGADAIVNIGFEVAIRETMMTGADKFIIYDDNGQWKFNREALFMISSGLIAGSISRPIEIMDNFVMRYLSWRLFHGTSLMITKGIFGDEVSKQFVMTDLAYGATLASGMGEAERLFRYGKYIKGQGSASKKFAIILAFSLTTRSIKTPFRIKLYSDAKTHPYGLAGSLKDNAAEYLNMNLDNFTREEIEAMYHDVMEMDDDQMKTFLQTGVFKGTNLLELSNEEYNKLKKLSDEDESNEDDDCDSENDPKDHKKAA